MTKPNSVDAASLHPIVPRPLADEVADKAKRVFQFMVSQDGNKAFGSVFGTNILITIERVETDRPAWWPVDWDWPPMLSDAEALRIIQTWASCDSSSPDTREKAMADIVGKCKSALS